MQKQTDMELCMLTAHRQFITALEMSLQLLEDDINEAADISKICTDEWCTSIEDYIDWLHKSLYSISEPRWAEREDSKKILILRDRVHDLYTNFKGTKH